jgi:hypothetical protein
MGDVVARFSGRLRAKREMGVRLSFTSLPATIGMASSRSDASARRIRDFACPRRPRRMK